MFRPYVKCALFRVWNNAHVVPAQKIKRTEAEVREESSLS